MVEKIENLAAGVKLTKNDKIVLDYILKNKETACFQTAAEIAKILGVSPSSVVRVSIKLGYASFGRFRRALQEETAKSRTLREKEPIPYEKIKNYSDLTEEELICVVKGTALQNLKQDQSTADFGNYKRAAELISCAKRVFLVGFRACAGFSASFGVMLSCVRPGVYVVSANQPVIDFLVDLDEADTVVAMSYERYSSDTIFAVNMAKKAGSHIVALTDKYTSPICPGADAVILNSTDSLSFYNSYVGLTMSMEVLAALVSRKNKDQNEKRLMKMEEFLRETGQY